METIEVSAHLVTREIEASYGKLKVLRGVSVEARAGQVVLVIGRNGSGKSTLLKTIFGLTPLDGGQVVLDGVDISTERPDQKVRRGIALVPQASNRGRGIFQELSIRENLQLGGFSLNAASSRQQAEDRVFQLFPVLGERLKVKAGALSGGQQQMLAVSTALMAQPRVLMLDEPTSGLAVGAAQELMRKIREIATTLEVAVILVEQNIQLALASADWVYACQGGRVARHGLPAEVMQGASLFDIL